MDRHKSVPAWLLALLTLVWFSGCGWWSAQTDRDVEEDIADSIDEPTTTAAASNSAAVAPSKLDLGLKAGDRFPLLKTVRQTLQQPSPQGWVVSHSILEILMSVSIEEIHHPDSQHPELDPRSGQKRLLVKFERVRFSQELPGQPRVEYDSNAPTFPIPQAALGYHGLKDNSLGFWLSADNQILELVGFEQFINHCLKEISPEKRQQMSTAIAVPTAAEGIASFVDDSIGLLPATAVREGDTWMRDRQVLQPVPLHISHKHTLRQITADVADIDIQGTVSPPVPHGSMNQPVRDVRVAVRGGQSLGRCRLNRRTGLPIDARVEQSLEMTVRMADGSEFDQYKSTITSIQSFSEQGSPQIGTGESAAPPAQTPRVTQRDSIDRSAAGNVSRPGEAANISTRGVGGQNP